MDEKYVCSVMIPLYIAVIQTYCVFGTLNGGNIYMECIHFNQSTSDKICRWFEMD